MPHALEPRTRSNAFGVARQFQAPCAVESYGGRDHRMPKFQRISPVDVAGPCACGTGLTVDKRGADTRPFSGKFTFRWQPGTELFEYICQGADYGAELPGGIGGQYEGARPPTPFLP